MLKFPPKKKNNPCCGFYNAVLFFASSALQKREKELQSILNVSIFNCSIKRTVLKQENAYLHE